MKEIMRRAGMRLGRINREYVLLFFIVFLVCLLLRAANAPSQLAPYHVTLTSFYPSPFGEYSEIHARRVVDYDDANFVLDPNGTSVLQDLIMRSDPIDSGNDTGNLIMIRGRILSSSGAGQYYIDLNNTTDPPVPAAMYVYSLMTEHKIVMGAQTPGSPANPPLRGKHVYGDPLQPPNDIAEGVFVKDCEAGDVVIISADENPEFIKSAGKFDSRVAGVISTEPLLYLGHGGGRMPLALAGIVPCKVTTENGPIRRGDLLVTASEPGHAMRAEPAQINPGMLLGKALQPCVEEKGLIYILVNKQ